MLYCFFLLVHFVDKKIILTLKGLQFSQTIVRQALTVLKVLAGNDEVKHEIAKLGGVELAVNAMITHAKSASIAEAVCKVLTAITLRNAENCQKVVECEGHQHIVQAMRLHPGDVGVQVSFVLLFNLISLFLFTLF